MFRIIITGLLTATCLAPARTAGAQEGGNTPLSGYADNAPIVLSGTVGEVRDGEFVLNYGGNAIDVDMENWVENGQKLSFVHPGDKVTVSGKIDDNFFNGREIEANNIYLNNSYVYYYHDSDDADYPAYAMADRDAGKDGAYVSLRGRVKNISGSKFTVTGPNGDMKVDTSELGYDPFDNKGLQHIRVGDKVHVFGDLDDAVFQKREVMAHGIVTLARRDSGTGKTEY